MAAVSSSDLSVAGLSVCPPKVRAWPPAIYLVYDQLAAHITCEQILVVTDVHRLLAHHLTQFVVLARRRHKQTHRIGIATPERLGKLFAHDLAHLTWGHRRIRAAKWVTQIRIDLHMLTGNIGDIDLLAGLVVVARRLALAVPGTNRPLYRQAPCDRPQTD